MSLVGLAHGTSHFHHLLLAPLFPVFLKEFGLSYTQLGMLVTVFFTVSGIGQAVSGFVVDRVGPLRVLWLALGCFVLASVAAAAADGLGGLMLAAMLAGLGNAPFHPIDFTILNRRVSAQRLGSAFAVHGISGNLGWALAPVFLLGITQAAGDWRWAYVASAVLGLLVLVCLVMARAHLQVPALVAVSAPAVAASSKGDSAHATTAFSGHPLAFLALPAVWWCFAFFFWTTGALSAIQSFASPALHQLYGLPLTTTAMVVTAYMLCGAAGMVMGGWAVGRVKRLASIITGALLLSALLLVLVASGLLGAHAALAATALAGVGTGLAGPSRDMLVKQAAPVGATGRVYGTVYSGLDLGFALAAPVFGLLMDKQLYPAVFVGSAGLLLLGITAARSAGAYAMTAGKTPSV